MPRKKRRRAAWKPACATVLLAGLIGATPAAAQDVQTPRGTRNVSVVGHLPDAGGTGDLDIEQDLSRPYAYVAGQAGSAGFHVIGLADPAQPEVVYSWQIGDPVDHPGPGAQDLTYFKLGDRYYLAQAFQFEDGPDADLGALVFDVTGLPDASRVREAARIRAPGGFHHLFAYRHSDGRTLLFATGGGDALVYDAAGLLAGDAEQGLVARLATPEQLQKKTTGYHNFFVGFDLDTQQDRFYGAGAGGYHVFDVSDLDAPVHLTSISSAAVQRGHTIAPTPDGRYVVTAAEYRTSPLRIFDLQPALDGQANLVRTAVGAWTADWRHFSQNFEVRWPYVFVAALDDGFQVFNMRDPEEAYTVGYYRTFDGPPARLSDPEPNLQGAWDLDVRNADGLIVVSDLNTGVWVFRLEGFEGWDGHGWGLPDMSSAQHWDAGPDGAR